MSKNIIFLPGMLLDARMWSGQVVSLKDDFKLHFFEYDQLKSYSECIESLDKLVSSLSGEVHLVSFSLGAIIAYEYAIEHQGKIKSLALLGISPDAYSDVEQARFEMMKKSAMKGEFQALGDKQIPIYLSSHSIENEALVQELKDIVNDSSLEEFLTQLSLVRSKVDRVEELTTFETPILWVAAKEDKLVLSKSLKNIVSNFSNSKFSLISDSGHMMTLEQPDVVSELLQNWLS